ncbi:MAG: tail fiber protein [Pseudomonadota bacterium]
MKISTRNILAALLSSAGILAAAPASAQAYVGEVRCFAFNFLPVGWAALDGTLLPIAQNDVLFALLGNQFGGDGKTTFALPDMRGRSPIDAGQGPGLSLLTLGQKLGHETTTLTVANLAPHTHTFAPLASNNNANSSAPAARVSAHTKSSSYADPANLSTMTATTSSASGGGAPVNTQSPALALTCGIATQGIFPSRN